MEKNGLIMAHLIIKNIGPIKSVDIELNKINVFMGPQSSGKSTIAKIISYCLWLEKKVCLFRDDMDTYMHSCNILEKYHNLQGYFGEGSCFDYESDYVKIKCTGTFIFVTVNNAEINKFSYRRAKILYIPAERNVTAIAGWTSFKLPDNNLKDFLNEWGVARGVFNGNERLVVSPLNVSYYYDEETNKDYISLSNSETTVAFTSASSGIQSSTPMYLLYKAYSCLEHRSVLNEMSSFKDEHTLNKILNNYDGFLRRMYGNDSNPIPEHETFNYKGYYYLAKLGRKEECIEVLNNYTEVQFVQSVIEEPELNLFPETQQTLIYELMADAVNNDNQLTITTHSPYILFALNNCMMGGLVGSHIPEEEAKACLSYHSWIDPKKVSIYEIHDGMLKSVQDNDGILEDNYMNQAYKKNSDEYLSLLNYYEDEE